MQTGRVLSFLEGDAALHRRVAQLASLWMGESNADVTFEFWNEPRDPSAADIRVAFQSQKGSWSYIGKYARRIPRNASTMNLGWMTLQLPEAEARAVVLHEFGHALGLVHEHLNPTRIIDLEPGKSARGLAAIAGLGRCNDRCQHVHAVRPEVNVRHRC